MENLAQIALAFTRETFIIPLIIVGYLWVDKKTFLHAICLVLFSMLFNTALKLAFKVPLASHLGPGFAFPNGHMQLATVLYGYFLTQTKNRWMRLILIALIVAVGWALVYSGYHDIRDVLGGLFFAGALVVLYVESLKRQKRGLVFIMLGVVATLLMVYIDFAGELLKHVWMAYYALLGLMLSEMLFQKKRVQASVANRSIATVSCFLAVFLITKAFNAAHLPLYLNSLQWLCVGFFIPFSPIFAHRLYKR